MSPRRTVDAALRASISRFTAEYPAARRSCGGVDRISQECILAPASVRAFFPLGEPLLIGGTSERLCRDYTCAARQQWEEQQPLPRRQEAHFSPRPREIFRDDRSSAGAHVTLERATDTRDLASRGRDGLLRTVARTRANAERAHLCTCVRARV